MPAPGAKHCHSLACGGTLKAGAAAHLGVPHLCAVWRVRVRAGRGPGDVSEVLAVARRALLQELRGAAVCEARYVGVLVFPCLLPLQVSCFRALPGSTAATDVMDAAFTSRCSAKPQRSFSGEAHL